MKKVFCDLPKSSFLGLPKDTALIMNKILSNQKVLKLFYYTTPDWESKSDLTAEQIKEMFDKKQISNVPKVTIDEDRRTYMRLSFDSFAPNAENSYYRNCIMEIKIICHFEDWDIGNFELRPFRIAGEIDSMLSGQRLTGIGLVDFISAGVDVYDDEFAGVTLRYIIYSGNEDKVNPLE